VWKVDRVLTYRWTVVSPPPAGTGSVIGYGPEDGQVGLPDDFTFFSGPADTQHLCGGCGFSILRGTMIDQVSGIHFVCPQCGGYNFHPIEMVLPPDLVSAIGRVAVNGTRLEVDLVGTLWSALGHLAPIRRTGGKVQVPADQVTRAVEELRLVAKSRLRGAFLAEVRAWLDSAKAEMDRRSRVVHGVWTPVPDDVGRHRCTAYLRKSPILPGPPADRWLVTEVEAVAGRLLSLRHQLLDLLPRLQTAIQEMSAAAVDEQSRPTELNAGIG
jgi:hypothetical protein